MQYNTYIENASIFFGSVDTSTIITQENTNNVKAHLSTTCYLVNQDLDNVVGKKESTGFHTCQEFFVSVIHRHHERANEISHWGAEQASLQPKLQFDYVRCFARRPAAANPQ